MTKKTVKNYFIEGAISADKIAKTIANHQSKTKIGAHSIFLGQIRADEIEGKAVTGIEYSAYESMANIKIDEIKEKAIVDYELSCLHIYHSIGEVATGEICLFVFASSPHRPAVFAAMEKVVEDIKATVPIFGKELFKDKSYQWKVNR